MLFLSMTSLRAIDGDTSYHNSEAFSFQQFSSDAVNVVATKSPTGGEPTFELIKDVDAKTELVCFFVPERPEEAAFLLPAIQYLRHDDTMSSEHMSVARTDSAQTGCVYIFQLPQTVSPSFAVQRGYFGQQIGH